MYLVRDGFVIYMRKYVWIICEIICKMCERYYGYFVRCVIVRCMRVMYKYVVRYVICIKILCELRSLKIWEVYMDI